MALPVKTKKSAEVPLDMNLFWSEIRKAKVFGPTLSQMEVDGVNTILDAWVDLGWPSDLRWVAYSIATAYHEARLDAAIKEWGLGAGKTYGKPAGPFGQVYYGRSYPQLTWYDNYVKFGKLLNLPLAQKPDLVLDEVIGAKVLILGCRDGLFRGGKRFSVFFNASTNNPIGARDIVNGDVRKNGALVASYHEIILDALELAFKARPNVAPVVAVKAPPVASLPQGGPVSGIVSGAPVRPPTAPLVPIAEAPVGVDQGSWFGNWLRKTFPKKV